MKLKIAIVIAAAILSTSAFAEKGGAGQEGNGGVVVKRNGRLMTFYSAGVVVDSTGEKTRAEIPGLEGLLDFIAKSQFLNANQQSRMISELIPSERRAYYKVDENRFTPEVKRRLIAEHSRVTGEPVDELRLACLTDTSKGVTFLFPNFYELDPNGQMAMLMHEALWMLFQKANYKWIDSAEIAFQAYLEDPTNIEKAFYFVSKISNSVELFELAVKKDTVSGILRDGKISANGQTMAFTYRNLLGEAFINCMDRGIPSEMQMNIKNCKGLLQLQAMRLIKAFPDSAFIGFWNSRMSSPTNLTLYHRWPSDQNLPEQHTCQNVPEESITLKTYTHFGPNLWDSTLIVSAKNAECGIGFHLFLGDSSGIRYEN